MHTYPLHVFTLVLHCCLSFHFFYYHGLQNDIGNCFQSLGPCDTTSHIPWKLAIRILKIISIFSRNDPFIELFSETTSTVFSSMHQYYPLNSRFSVIYWLIYFIFFLTHSRSRLANSLPLSLFFCFSFPSSLTSRFSLIYAISLFLFVCAFVYLCLCLPISLYCYSRFNYMILCSKKITERKMKMRRTAKKYNLDKNNRFHNITPS